MALGAVQFSRSLGVLQHFARRWRASHCAWLSRTSANVFALRRCRDCRTGGRSAGRRRDRHTCSASSTQAFAGMNPQHFADQQLAIRAERPARHGAGIRAQRARPPGAAPSRRPTAASRARSPRPRCRRRENRPRNRSSPPPAPRPPCERRTRRRDGCCAWCPLACDPACAAARARSAAGLSENTLKKLNGAALTAPFVVERRHQRNRPRHHHAAKQLVAVARIELAQGDAGCALVRPSSVTSPAAAPRRYGW